VLGDPHEVVAVWHLFSLFPALKRAGRNIKTGGKLGLVHAFGLSGLPNALTECRFHRNPRMTFLSHHKKGKNDIIVKGSRKAMP
jgi:hypothetical protein